jgi:hypothetical protein
MIDLGGHTQVMAQAIASPGAGLPEAAPELPAAAARFVRADHLRAGYSASRHITLTAMLAAAIAIGGAVLAARARPLDWVLAPVFFVFANFIEWMVHRHPMHHPQPPRFMYHNHTILHHLAFTDGNMPIARAAEMGLVMMPWYTMIGLFTLASPVMVVAGLMRGPGLAGVFLLAAVAYFLMYETLHALYHLPDTTLDRLGVGRRAVFRRLQAHHAHHHILGRMAHVNFNVTIPLMDVVLGTNEKPKS